MEKVGKRRKGRREKGIESKREEKEEGRRGSSWNDNGRGGKRKEGDGEIRRGGNGGKKEGKGRETRKGRYEK